MGQHDDPPTLASLRSLKPGLDRCRRCDLWRDATQGVGGEGPAPGLVMLVGEQPGDKEDLAGAPFVGPAGRILDEALAAADLPRERLYITNAVKHFKNEPRGKLRLHKKPDAGEVEACRWWLRQELRLVQPRLIVALGDDRRSQRVRQGGDHQDAARRLAAAAGGRSAGDGPSIIPAAPARCGSEAPRV
jgi:uracil-DNA glycosylase family protein